MANATEVSVITSLNLSDAPAALEFYKEAFGAEEDYRVAPPPGDMIVHAQFRIGQTTFYASSEFPEMDAIGPLTTGSCPFSLALRVSDVDAAYERAVAAGAEAVSPPENYFWGERTGTVKDPFGYRWSLSTEIESLTPEEVLKRMAEQENT